MPSQKTAYVKINLFEFIDMYITRIVICNKHLMHYVCQLRTSQCVN